MDGDEDEEGINTSPRETQLKIHSRCNDNLPVGTADPLRPLVVVVAKSELLVRVDPNMGPATSEC